MATNMKYFIITLDWLMVGCNSATDCTSHKIDLKLVDMKYKCEIYLVKVFPI